MNTWLTFLAISFCAASISFTVTISGMFESMRNWIYDRSKFFGQLITCPWCFGHYVVFIIVAILGIFIPISNYKIINYLFTSFTIIGVTGIWYKILLTAFDPVMKIKAQREINKMKEAKAKAEAEKSNS